MADTKQDLEELTRWVREFCENREWDQYHGAKDLAIGLVTESSELLDIFRFQAPEQVEELVNNEQSRKAVEEEVADVMFFLLRFGQMYNIDLKKALHNKLEKNACKYPVEQFRGLNTKASSLRNQES